jgi:hypothetical protein
MGFAVMVLLGEVFRDFLDLILSYISESQYFFLNRFHIVNEEGKCHEFLISDLLLLQVFKLMNSL